MTYEQKLEADVAARIVNDLANHTITVKHADGLYRHYRCQNGSSSNLYFDVVTWPGSLCFTGDMGDYLFQRMPDMIAFMSTAIRDRSYVAQKCVAGKVKEWREEAFEEVLAERLASSLEDGSDGTYRFTVFGGKREDRSVAEAIEEIRDEYANYNSQHDAMKAMYESGLWDEVPQCEEWTFHFIWCLHAMKWFCEKLQQVEVKAIDCGCRRCLEAINHPDAVGPERRMILCKTCGSKRCPHATDHRNECTNSNKPGQIGSDY